MQPNEALAYLTQVCNDYGRTLPPSAAAPFQQVAQDAVNSLAQLVNPPPVEADQEPGKLRAVPSQE